MPLYLGNEKLNKLYLGGDEVSKIYLGDDLVYSKGSSDEILYTGDNGHSLVINSSYPIPTTIYKAGGTTETTTTYLSSPLDVGNLLQPTYSEGYSYNPQLTTEQDYSELQPPPGSQPVGHYYIEGLYENATYTGGNFPLGRYQAFLSDITGTPSNPLTEYTSTIKVVTPPTSNSKLVIKPYMYGYTNEYYEYNMRIQVQIIDTVDKEVLAESSTDVTFNHNKMTYFSNLNETTPLALSSGQKFQIRLKITRLNEPSNPWAEFMGGKLKIFLRTYLYNTPLYCNISRVIIEDEQYPYDNISISVNSTDTNSLRMISLTEDGVATITNKDNGGN